MKKLFLTFLLFLSSSVFAQINVPMIIPYEPGGVTDKFGRILAKHLSNKDYNFVITYKTGAGGQVASNYLATVKGTHILVATNTVVVAPIFNTVRYDYNKFVPINWAAFEPTVIVTNRLSNLLTLDDAFKSGTHPFATGGVGTSGHLLTLVLNQYGNFIHVPYKGAAPVLPALFNNDVSLTVDTISGIGQHIDAGTVIPLAVIGAKRVSKFPKLKTLREYGIDDTGLNRWFSLMGSEESSPEIINYINSKMKDPELLKELTAMGMEVNTSIKLTDFLKAETKRVSELYERVK